MPLGASGKIRTAAVRRLCFWFRRSSSRSRRIPPPSAHAPGPIGGPPPATPRTASESFSAKCRSRWTPSKSKANRNPCPSSNMSAGGAAATSARSRRDFPSSTETSSELLEHGATSSADAGRSPTAWTESTLSLERSLMSSTRSGCADLWMTDFGIVPGSRPMNRTTWKGSVHSHNEHRTPFASGTAKRRGPPLPTTGSSRTGPAQSAKVPESKQRLEISRLQHI